MRRGVLLVLLALLGLLAGPARAHDGGWHVDRYDVHVRLAEDGAMWVTVDMDYDFGGEPGHGPYVTLPVRQEFDEGRDRVYEVDAITASSPTAPAKTYVDRSLTWVEVRVGDEDVDDVTGVHRYTIGYRLRGMLNPGGDVDALYWNVLGSGWTIPVRNVTVVVEGLAEPLAVACYAGPEGSTERCGAQTSGTTATFHHDGIAPREQMTIALDWPAGTYPGAEILLDEARREGDVFLPASGGGVVALLVLLLGLGGVVTLVRTRGRDEAYLGITPGLSPASGQDVAVGKRRRQPIAVQFAPPEGLRPGVVGTLLDEVADPHDVTATLVDLAVRGYLRIEEVPRKNPDKPAKDWTLVPLRDPDASLQAYERRLLQELFPARTSVTLSSLRSKGSFGETMAKVQKDLYGEVVQRGWFRQNPATVRTWWRVAGFALCVVGFVGTMVLAETSAPKGSALVPLALALLGAAVLLASKHAPARTAEGTAVLAHALGFKQYLATAEARQLRFEEHQDLFSRYLPWAIAFGETKRWARVFAEAAARQGAEVETGWYVGTGYALWHDPDRFSSSLAGFASTASTAMAATPGGSGGSGTAGGFSGGGGGGGGGGGW